MVQEDGMMNGMVCRWNSVSQLMAKMHSLPDKWKQDAIKAIAGATWDYSPSSMDMKGFCHIHNALFIECYCRFKSIDLDLYLERLRPQIIEGVFGKQNMDPMHPWVINLAKAAIYHNFNSMF